jgi:ABC-type phosphate/phosphonate transport system ATPase subunit
LANAQQGSFDAFTLDSGEVLGVPENIQGYYKSLSTTRVDGRQTIGFIGQGFHIAAELATLVNVTQGKCNPTKEICKTRLDLVSVVFDSCLDAVLI